MFEASQSELETNTHILFELLNKGKARHLTKTFEDTFLIDHLLIKNCYISIPVNKHKREN